MKATGLEVSYHRTVNLGNYSNVHLGGKYIFANDGDTLTTNDYIFVQEELKKVVDLFADRIADEAKLSQRSK